MKNKLPPSSSTVVYDHGQNSFPRIVKKINPNNPEKVGELHELSHQKLIRLQRKKENLVHANSQ